MADLIYINGTQIKEISGEYGSFFNMSIKYDALKEHVNEKGYINMTISKRKEVGQYWDTHYATLNTWVKPEEKKENNNSWDISVEDIPF